MTKYILRRLLRSVFSIVVVVGIVFTLIYSLIPRQNIFNNDTTYNKYKAGDERKQYELQQYDKFGYIEYVTLVDYCYATYETGTEEYTNCTKVVKDQTNPEIERFTNYYKSKNYTVGFYTTGVPYAYKDVSPIKMLFNWILNIIEIDHPNKVVDKNNPDLERKIYFGTDWNGKPAILCSGCESKYLYYFDNKFPFLHTNLFKINLGESFPTFQGNSVLDVITDRQNENVKREVTFPTGEVANTALIEYSCKYKSLLSSQDKRRFLDNYAECDSYKSDPSMIGTSFLIGVISTILAYLLGFPIGLFMAKNKNKVVDKIGIAYIIFIISVPSLAYIFMFSRVGSWFGLPVKYAQFGAHNPLSYILPIISLALPSVAGLMMWMRRYMIDQSLSDYVKFARAKGLSESSIFSKHIMRNAIIPIVHGIPGAILGSLTGAIITERVYAVPGMGKMLTDAINAYNNQMVIALTFIFTSLSVFSLLLGDILMTIVDPRITFTENGR